MVIKIIKNNFDINKNSSAKPFIISTLNTKGIFNLLLEKNIISFIKEIGRYIYFSLKLNTKYFRFSFYSNKDFLNFRFLFSPSRVIVKSNKNLIVLNDKINSAYSDTIELFFSIFTYNLFSVLSKIERYQKVVSDIIFKKCTVRFSKRFLYFTDYFFIKRRFIKNQHSLNKILNSPFYDIFSASQRNDFNSLVVKNEIVIKYISLINNKFLLLGFINKKQLNSSIVSLSILSIFAITVIYLSYSFNENVIPFLLLVQLFFLFIFFFIDHSHNRIHK